MTKQSSHRRWKGHCLMCAWNRGKVKGIGKDGVPFKVKRQLGQARRVDKRRDAE